jgi:hypothetical protein
LFAWFRLRRIQQYTQIMQPPEIALIFAEFWLKSLFAVDGWYVVTSGFAHIHVPDPLFVLVPSHLSPFQGTTRQGSDQSPMMCWRYCSRSMVVVSWYSHYCEISLRSKSCILRNHARNPAGRASPHGSQDPLQSLFRSHSLIPVSFTELLFVSSHVVFKASI